MKVSKGVWYMVIAAFTFSLMKARVQYISHIPAIEIILFRSGVSLVISGAFLLKQKVPLLGNNRKVLLLRGLAGAGSLTLYFYLLQQIPLAAAATMMYLSPIFTAVLGVYIVKERVSWKQYVFFGISFLGILVIQGFDARITFIHLIIGVSSAIFTGLAYNFVRKLKSTEHPLVIILYFPLVTLPIAGIASIFLWVQPKGFDWVMLILVGVLTQIAQYFMTRSYQLEEVSKVSIVNYTGILYALIFGFFIFGETYEWMSFAGMGLVLVGIILNIRFKK